MVMQRVPASAREGPESRDFQHVLAKGTGRERHVSQGVWVLSDPRQQPRWGLCQAVQGVLRPGSRVELQMKDLARVTMWSTPHATSTGSPGMVTCRTRPSTA